MLHVAAQYQPIFRRIGLDEDLIFSHPQIKPWRTLDDRQNCTLDATRDDGSPIRLHVKRYATTLAENEIAAFELLRAADIPTAPLVAWGKAAHGRSFVITEDLTGFQAADKLIESGVAFDLLLNPTAELAAKLHRAGLHHRDLYLCHFFATDACVDLRLIDIARVRRLPTLFTRQRWIVKDLAQFWYSTLNLPINDSQRNRWLARYAQQSGSMTDVTSLRRAIERKVARIARHDQRLNRAQPGRNISIPI